MEGLAASVEELTTLLEILEEEKPLEVAAARFQKSFHKTDQFKASCTLYLMIRDDLVSLSAKMVAYYILFDLYNSSSAGGGTGSESNLPGGGIAANPFLPCFLVGLQKEGSDPKVVTERNFLLSLLTDPNEVRQLFCRLSLSGVGC